MLLLSSKPWPSGLIKWLYNSLCVVDEESISDMLNDEFSNDSDDEMNLEFEGETVSEESSNKMSESESESKTSVLAC
jgi:hypothetical protein